MRLLICNNNNNTKNMNNEKNRNAKGKSQSTSRQLSALEKVTLTLWMDIITAYDSDGQHIELTDAECDPVEIVEKMNQLHRRIAKIESELGILFL